MINIDAARKNDGTIEYVAPSYIVVTILTSPPEYKEDLKKLGVDYNGIQVITSRYETNGSITLDINEKSWDVAVIAQQVYEYFIKKGLNMVYNPDDFSPLVGEIN